MGAAGPRLVAVLGRGVVEPSTPVLSGDDLGLTRGDGCFDATRLVVADDGTTAIDHLDAHLARFARSAAALDLPSPDEAAWRSLVAEAAAAWADTTGPGEAVLRVMLTRGREVAPATPITGVLTIAPLDPAATAARCGIAVITLSRGHRADAFAADVPWLLGGIKTLSYAVNVAAGREATRRGADDVLFTSTDGYALEAPRSALVWRVGDELRSTRHDGTGILASITQAAIFAAARADGIRAELDLIPVGDLAQVDGAWLVSSGRLVAPVLRLDDITLPHDPTWTTRLHDWATR